MHAFTVCDGLLKSFISVLIIGFWILQLVLKNMYLCSFTEPSLSVPYTCNLVHEH